MREGIAGNLIGPPASPPPRPFPLFPSSPLPYFPTYPRSLLWLASRSIHRELNRSVARAKEPDFVFGTDPGFQQEDRHFFSANDGPYPRGLNPLAHRAHLQPDPGPGDLDPVDLGRDQPYPDEFPVRRSKGVRQYPGWLPGRILLSEERSGRYEKGRSAQCGKVHEQ